LKGYLLFFLLLLLIHTSCGREDAETKPMPETDQTLGVEEFTPGLPVRQVIIDTDMAVDDWFAILYLLQKPEVNVLAITVTGTGEAHCDPGVKNALGLVKLADHDPVPVACGVETPLKGNNVFPDSFRDSVDSMLGIQLPKGKNPASASDAVE
jgi:pyrimidine-specific ribonucleoside hydrolase